MGEKQALSGIQGLNLFHLIFAESEVKNIKILFHAVLVGGLGNQYHIGLKEKTQSSLGNGFTMSVSDFFQDRIIEIIIFAFCKRSPGHDLSAVFLHIFLCSLLLLEYMGLHLVYGRFDP